MVNEEASVVGVYYILLFLTLTNFAIIVEILFECSPGWLTGLGALLQSSAQCPGMSRVKVRASLPVFFGKVHVNEIHIKV